MPLLAPLLDHLVRKDKQVRGQRQAKGLGRLEIEDKLKLHGLLYRSSAGVAPCRILWT